MIKINDRLSIDEKNITLEFIRSSGPGGQNVNKVSTAVQLRFNLKDCKELNSLQKERIIKAAGKKMSQDGVLIINARRFRSQERNRTDAYNRLRLIISRSLKKKKTRKKTRPTLSSVENRLKEKKILSEKKRGREKLKSEDY